MTEISQPNTCETPANWKYVSAGTIKVGDIIMIDDEPQKVVSISISNAGKHGRAKITIRFRSLNFQTHM